MSSELRATIDGLTERNRSRRRSTLERRLVRERLDAAQRLAESVPAESGADWPASFEDPFDSTAGPVPEVQASELRLDLLGGALRHHGLLVVRGLFTEAAATGLADDVEQAFTAMEAAEAGGSTRRQRSWYTPQGEDKPTHAGNLVRLVDSPRAMFNLFELIEATPVVDLVSRYLQSPAVFTAKKTGLRRVHAADVFTDDFHQDGAFLGEEVRSLNLWISLSQCGEDAPGLDVIPRRLEHVPTTGGGDAMFKWSVAANDVEELTGAGPIRLGFAPGDAVFFDQFLMHRTGADPGMPNRRYAVESWFFAVDHRPDDYTPLLA